MRTLPYTGGVIGRPRRLFPAYLLATALLFGQQLLVKDGDESDVTITFANDMVRKLEWHTGLD